MLKSECSSSRVFSLLPAPNVRMRPPLPHSPSASPYSLLVARLVFPKVLDIVIPMFYNSFIGEGRNKMPKEYKKRVAELYYLGLKTGKITRDDLSWFYQMLPYA